MFRQLEQKNKESDTNSKFSKNSKNATIARERIMTLLDTDSFQEVDKFVIHRTTGFGMEDKKYVGDGVITGYGTIEGRSVCIFSQDSTVLGGSLGEMHAKKILKIMELAMKTGCPIIGFNDSGGARIQEGVSSLAGYGEIFRANVKASGVVPQISIIFGPCAGGAVYSPALTDFIIMVDKSSYMFITGPNVIKSVTGEEIEFEQLGGAKTHNTISGVAHFIASNESHAIALLKKLLNYLPQNNLTEPLKISTEAPKFSATEIRETIPDNSQKAYDVKDVITKIVDSASFFEVQSGFAKNLVIGFARISGLSVGIVANQPKILAGTLDINASDKGARFVRFCDAFKIPILTLVDVPGFLPGSTQEFGGIIRHGAKLLFAYCEATVAKLTVILRKSYGGAYDVLGSRHGGADHVFAWPTAEIAVMGADGATNIIFRKEIQKSTDPIKTKSKIVKQYEDRFLNPYIAAELGLIDSIIFPEETRDSLIKALQITKTKREFWPPKKHGNIPL